MSDLDESRIGKLSMSGKDVNHSVRCNALAFQQKFGSYEVMVMSVAGASTALKSIQAALNSKAKVVFQPDDIPGAGSYMRLVRSQAQYDCGRHRLRYGMWHMLAIAQVDGLLVDSSDESLWRALQSDAITTPLLRSWVPYLRAELIRHEWLTPLRCYGCNASILSASVENIDQLVESGIRYGALRFEEQST